MYERILVVCTGNICRSPVAEYILRDSLTRAGRRCDVRSAGVGALVGESADGMAVSLMAQRGLDLAPHVAQQATRELCRWADLVLVMETHHRDAVAAIDPAVRGKTFLLGYWQKQEVPDPFQRSRTVWSTVVDLIDGGVDEWVKRL
ncbi:low molecular weight protein-tyrosine-phosphatase [Zoogloea sp.]|uniref:low molecular weight protein-tyrosine-phosphatase n=1 Tax=Zoogloea sp. TaxID=49181 RepID=UPI00345AF0FD